MTDYDERRIKALRRLPYAEYLKTEHWQRQRRGALGHALSRCQVCNTNAVLLEVHHRTYARLGCEQPSDLLVLCEACHELFSRHGRLAEQMEDLQPRRSNASPDEDVEEEDTPDWDEDETALVEVDGHPSPLTYVMDHPHLTLGGGSLLLSFVIDVAVRFDSFAIIVGLGTAAVIGWKGEDLVDGTMKLLVPGSDQAQVQEDADRFASDFLDDYPMHPDQRPISKIRRLFGIDKVVEALPQKESDTRNRERAKRSSINQEEGLTYARIAEWFEEGRIDDTQFFTLLDRIENPKSAVSRHRNRYRNDDENEAEAASREAVSPQNEPLRPDGWDDEKIHRLTGAFLATNHLDNSLKAIGLSTSQRNRDFARDILKQQGLWKDK